MKTQALALVAAMSLAVPGGAFAAGKYPSQKVSVDHDKGMATMYYPTQESCEEQRAGSLNALTISGRLDTWYLGDCEAMADGTWVLVSGRIR